MILIFILILATPTLAAASQVSAHQGTAANPENYEALAGLEPETSQGCSFDKSAEVVHVPQFHWRAEFDENDKETVDAVAKSQFEIAQIILANPDRAVFIEALYEDMDEKVFEQMKKDESRWLRVAKTYFPKGLPQNFEDLSLLQKQLLSQEGAPRVLYILGKLKTIHRTMIQAESEQIDAEIKKRAAELGGIEKGVNDPVMRRLIFDRRDAAATREVTDYRKAHPGEKVLLVFGSAHDFTARFKGVSFAKASNCKVPSDAELETLAINSNRKRRDARPELFKEWDGPLQTFDTFKGNFEKALPYYGNLELLNPEVFQANPGAIMAEQEKILQALAKQKQKIRAGDWQHFLTPELKMKGLEFINPDSLKPDYFSVNAFRKIISNDPELKKAGEAWLSKNSLE